MAGAGGDVLDDFLASLESKPAKAAEAATSEEPADPRPAKRARVVSAVASAAPVIPAKVVEEAAVRTTPAYGGGTEEAKPPAGDSGAQAYPRRSQNANEDVFAKQQSAYVYDPKVSAAVAERESKPGPAKASKPRKFVRVGAGDVWEDKTLAEWPDNDWRLFVGDLGNETTDEMLGGMFKDYSSYAMAKVIRNKHNGKTRGYGFVSFLDGLDMMKALREKQGVYLGNRPMKLRKSDWADQNIGSVRKKEKKEKYKKKKLGLT